MEVMMASPHKQYTKELYNQFTYLAMWLPSVPIKLGDVGIFNKGRFERITRLRNLGLSFEIRQDKTPSQVSYATEGAVSLSFKAEGEAPPPVSQLTAAQAGFLIEMTRANATLFQALETYSPSIEDQVTLGKQILELYKTGEWDLKYFVVTEILEARSATILISSSVNARVELSATGKINPGMIDLADIHAGLRLEHSRNMNTQIIATAGLTPLFKARSVKKRFGLGNAFFRDSEFELSGLTPEDIDYEE
jgi:hypothetical protein